MASYFNLTLDTTAPAGCSVQINNGATKVSVVNVSLLIGCTDPETSGYTMKVYGDIKVGDNATSLTKDDVSWENYSTSKSVTLLDGDGLKTVKVVIRDDVYNEAAEVSATITLDTEAPNVVITGPDVSKISTQPGRDSSTFTFEADEAFIQYKVKVVPSISSTHDTGTDIPTTGGSVNMSGTGSFPASTGIECKIKGSDFSAAVGGSDGVGIVKVFVYDGLNWSV